MRSKGLAGRRKICQEDPIVGHQSCKNLPGVRIGHLLIDQLFLATFLPIHFAATFDQSQLNYRGISGPNNSFGSVLLVIICQQSSPAVLILSHGHRTAFRFIDLAQLGSDGGNHAARDVTNLTIIEFRRPYKVGVKPTGRRSLWTSSRYRHPFSASMAVRAFLGSSSVTVDHAALGDTNMVISSPLLLSMRAGAAGAAIIYRAIIATCVSLTLPFCDPKDPYQSPNWALLCRGSRTRWRSRLTRAPVAYHLHRVTCNSADMQSSSNYLRIAGDPSPEPNRSTKFLAAARSTNSVVSPVLAACIVQALLFLENIPQLPFQRFFGKEPVKRLQPAHRAASRSL
ncbi:hypothetical protein BV22DRAFT_1046748 [Leucogyrophana mollusca]|uniref:Uncharacterized protein n=1 Tax=Leucogyrophana mollusca TaxID=85980 RepID=A0ACB8BJN3_9AGAM|nr:hypothetical protein BV22DRAFT_1046748 [Leucogyrophana mollusca]